MSTIQKDRRPSTRKKPRVVVPLGVFPWIADKAPTARKTSPWPVGPKKHLQAEILAKYSVRPAVALMLSVRIDERRALGENDVFLTAFGGGDPIEDLGRRTADALFALERVRAELLDSLGDVRAGVAPVWQNDLLGDVFLIEQSLASALDGAVSVCMKSARRRAEERAMAAEEVSRTDGRDR